MDGVRGYCSEHHEPWLSWSPRGYQNGIGMVLLQFDNGAQEKCNRWREVEEMCILCCHESIVEGALTQACSGEVLDTFGVACRGENVYVCTTLFGAQMEKYSAIEGPLVHLRVRSAERVC